MTYVICPDCRTFGSDVADLCDDCFENGEDFCECTLYCRCDGCLDTDDEVTG